MNRYENRHHVLASGLAAAVMTGLVLTLAVYAPTQVEPGHNARAYAARTYVEVAIVPSRIDVVGVRSQRTAANAAQPADARRAPNG